MQQAFRFLQFCSNEKYSNLQMNFLSFQRLQQDVLALLLEKQAFCNQFRKSNKQEYCPNHRKQ